MGTFQINKALMPQSAPAEAPGNSKHAAAPAYGINKADPMNSPWFGPNQIIHRREHFTDNVRPLCSDPVKCFDKRSIDITSLERHCDRLQVATSAKNAINEERRHTHHQQPDHDLHHSPAPSRRRNLAMA
jgi:hypothetical protein